ncbi:WG repeat-containing protein [Taibaiella chishuiensis]|uniref:WG repeat protein n=1 Tax=Taibaiella chishuiensis TaxID=1434707 RepID=A0A2P8CXV7_9BACT|nr:WG repeat-containing protein [Taibaiella chishuiensis]PSK89811.1 WG repeat protein [Taibaiella chishuiensis]
MTLRRLLPVLLLPLYIGACSGKNAQATAGKAEYINSLKDLSHKELQQRLKSEIAFMNALRDSARGVTLYLSFSISGSSGNGESGVKIDTAARFQLPAATAIVPEFASLKSGIIAEQRYALPQSGFEFSPDRRMEVIESDEISYRIDKVYTGGRELQPQQLKLQRADSLFLQASYRYPTAYDTLVIRKSDKDSVRYGNFSIGISAITGNEATLELPVAFNQQLIGYQASNAQGVLMKPTSYSSMPITGVASGVIAEIDAFREALKQALEQTSKEAALAEIGKIPEHAFTSRNRVQELLKSVQEIDKQEEADLPFKQLVQVIRQFKERYKDLLGPREQNLELKFQGDIDRIYLFVATRYDSFSQGLMAVNAYQQKGNNIFEDKTTGKYGIIDAASNIIIPARYNRLDKHDELYFTERVDTNEITWYLNSKEKKLEQIADGKKVSKQLDKDLVVFSDKAAYEGVLRNNKEEVVPFKYDNITLAGDVLVAEGSKRGRSFYEFYTTAGKKIDAGPVKKAITERGCNNIILVTPGNKYGIMNGKGQVSTQPRYERIEFITDYITTLAVYFETQGNGNTVYGIIDAEGKAITPANLDYIGDLKEDMIVFRSTGSPEKRYGYLNSKGQVQVPPRFDRAGDFIQGQALVSLNNRLCLVDKKGNTVFTFPGDVANAEVSVLDPKTDPHGAGYEINGKLYTPKGELIKK